jgi:hemerythrin-like metal-binding protein
MQFIPTGVARLDHALAGVVHCIVDLGQAMRDRDAASARGWACLLVQKLGDHFSDEEKMMWASRWPQTDLHAKSHRRVLRQFENFEQELKIRGVILELSYLALVHLPEMLRVHIITSDFSFAKFVTGRPNLPSSRFVARPTDASRRLASVQPSSVPRTPLN